MAQHISNMILGTALLTFYYAVIAGGHVLDFVEASRCKVVGPRKTVHDDADNDQ